MTGESSDRRLNGTTMGSNDKRRSLLRRSSTLLVGFLCCSTGDSFNAVKQHNLHHHGFHDQQQYLQQLHRPNRPLVVNTVPRISSLVLWSSNADETADDELSPKKQQRRATSKSNKSRRTTAKAISKEMPVKNGVRKKRNTSKTKNESKSSATVAAAAAAKASTVPATKRRVTKRTTTAAATTTTSTRKKATRNTATSTNKRSVTTSKSKYTSRTPSELRTFEILSNKLLTREEEKELGRKVQKSIQVKEMIEQFLLEKEASMGQYNGQQQQQQASNNNDRSKQASPSQKPESNDGGVYVYTEYDDIQHDHDNIDDEGDDYDGLSVYGVDTDRLRKFDTYSLVTRARCDEVRDEDDSNDASDSDDDQFTVHGGNQGGPTRRQIEPSFESNANTFLGFDETNVELTEQDIIEELQIKGGFNELEQILVDGAYAKEKMVSSNVRLVVSIATAWCKRSVLRSPDPRDRTIVRAYEGGWGRPSLEDAIHEGIIGLNRAVEKFDPERNFKFSTYATDWITNNIRLCFQREFTGCLRVPISFHRVEWRYHRAVKAYYKEHNAAMPVELAAEQLSLTPERLKFILARVRPMVSLDQPRVGTARTIAGKAGAQDMPSEREFALANLLPSTEESAEELIELSFLRQCLENAMAAELSPHERDVIRLRHGLDDGIHRTQKEIAEVYFGGALSIMEVSTTEQRAFSKLRSPYSVHTSRLLGFLEFVGIDRSTIKLETAKQR